jgi:hypothetical protein
MAENPTWIAIATGGDTVTVLREGAVVTQQAAPGIGRVVGRARDLRLGWAVFDDVEVVYVSDTAADHFGYAVNLATEDFSAWGYAPFAPTDEVRPCARRSGVRLADRSSAGPVRNCWHCAQPPASWSSKRTPRWRNWPAFRRSSVAAAP